MFDIEEKASVLKWLISAQGLEGIPTISEGYNLTTEELEELYGAELDVFGEPIPVTVNRLYYKDGTAINSSSISQSVIRSVSSSDILNGVEILPAPGEGTYYVNIQAEVSCPQVDYDIITLQHPYDLPKGAIQLEPYIETEPQELKIKINYTTR